MSSRPWTFLSNHAHVLICMATDPDARLRDVAERVGITERAVHNILGDLEREGLVTRERRGRRNHYTLDLDQPLRHPLESHRSVRELIQLVTRKRRQR
ncbi:MAG: winged helix-turn-helix domain-containing protein [Planctomycetota bacterium]